VLIVIFISVFYTGVSFLGCSLDSFTGYFLGVYIVLILLYIDSGSKCGIFSWIYSIIINYGNVIIKTVSGSILIGVIGRI